MKNYIVILFICSSFNSLFGQDQWVIKDSINGAPRSSATSFIANGEGIVVAGIDASGYRRKTYSYTYWQDDWDDEPSLGGVNGSGLARASACGFSIGNKGYITLGKGATSPFLNDLWEYDQVTKTWSQKADFIGEARRSAIAFTCDTLAYVGTGIAQSGFKKDMYQYSATTNSWTQIADFGGTARKEATAFSFGYQGFVATGDDGVYKNDLWMYTPATDTWVQKTSFPGTARKGAVSWSTFPTAFICTGEDINFNYTKDLWEYNFYDDNWVQRADFPGPGRTNAIAFVIQGVGFVGSGYDGIFYDDMFAYRRIVGIDEQDNYAQTKIYPNPIKSVFKIEVDPKDITPILYSSDGKDITKSLSINKLTDGFSINKNDLPPGAYFVKLKRKDFGTVFQSKLIFVE